MNRRFLTLIIAFMLLAMLQTEHALGHFGEWLRAPYRLALQLPDP